MGKVFDAIDDKLRAWIEAREMFFVATAPSGDGGLVNCSPKGLDSFRVLDETTVAYLDLTGSGIETVAHLKQNGRICIMFCTFKGPPKIVRIQGRGQVFEPSDERFDELMPKFPSLVGARAIIVISAERISDSCGFGVPLMDFVGQRSTLLDATDKKGVGKMNAYRKEKNSFSLDGLLGLREID